MKTAKVNDTWKNIYRKRDYAINVSELQYKNLRGLGEGTVRFEGGITAICGANGVGKTTLLNALLGTVYPESLQDSTIPLLRLDGSELAAELFKDGTAINRTVTVNDSVISANPLEMSVEAVWIDFSKHSTHLSSIFTDITHLDEELAAIEARVASTKELEMLSYIVGKNYSELKTYELEFSEYGEVPYFEVVSNGVQYNSKTMGLGELSVHYVLWHLQRIARDSIILIEEPETYLAPRSQEALINVLAKLSIEKNVWIVLTTHSPNILKKYHCNMLGC
jgi:predicted ATP-dependent endonuclease of OLD family